MARPKKQPAAAPQQPAPKRRGRPPKAKTAEPARMGRKSLFRPEYCDKLLQLCSDGLSFSACAAEFGISRRTLYLWAETIPEFARAKEVAEAAGLRFWENLAIGVAKGTLRGNAAVIIHQICNRFPDIYRQRVEIDHSHKKGNDLQDLTDEALQREIEAMTQIVN
jgi:hypothetical protein